MNLIEEVVEQLKKEDNTASELYNLSLNAISVFDAAGTIKLRAMLWNQAMLTLLNSGSSHSFKYFFNSQSGDHTSSFHTYHGQSGKWPDINQ